MAKFTGKLAEFLVNTGAWTAVGQVQEIGDIAVTAEEVDVTTLDAGDYRDYIQGFKDPGECELTVIFDPNLPTQGDDPNGLLGLFNSGVTKECAIRWNSSAPGAEEFGMFTAFIRDMNYGALNPDDPQTINPVWRLTSPITLADILPLLQPSFFQAPAAGATGSFTVICAPQPTLEATSDSPWLTVGTITPPTAGTGSVNYTVAPNATGQDLHGHITVLDLNLVFTVLQDA